MRNLLLSTVLIILPVGLFAAGYTILTPPASTAQTASVDAGPSLGDMSPFAVITTDVQKIAETGDLTAARTRITDLETAWDAQEKTLRPVNTTAWGNVDAAVDDALHALRAHTPDQTAVDAALSALRNALADPAGAGALTGGSVVLVSGVATTDAGGRPLPCETMLATFRIARAAAIIPDANVATIHALQAKGTERCNADDDARADDFFAQGIALMSN
jgi:hypothetical protein